MMEVDYCNPNNHATRSSQHAGVNIIGQSVFAGSYIGTVGSYIAMGRSLMDGAVMQVAITLIIMLVCTVFPGSNVY